MSYSLTGLQFTVLYGLLKVPITLSKSLTHASVAVVEKRETFSEGLKTMRIWVGPDRGQLFTLLELFGSSRIHTGVPRDLVPMEWTTIPLKIKTQTEENTRQRERNKIFSRKESNKSKDNLEDSYFNLVIRTWSERARRGLEANGHSCGSMVWLCYIKRGGLSKDHLIETQLHLCWSKQVFFLSFLNHLLTVEQRLITPPLRCFSIFERQ